MDVRGVQRLLEKTQGMAESAEHVGARTAEMSQREPRLSDAAKANLGPLYREHSLRLTQLYCRLGAHLCAAVENEMEDDVARGQLDLYRANFAALDAQAAAALEKEIGATARGSNL